MKNICPFSKAKVALLFLFLVFSIPLNSVGLLLIWRHAYIVHIMQGVCSDERLKLEMSTYICPFIILFDTTFLSFNSPRHSNTVSLKLDNIHEKISPFWLRVVHFFLENSAKRGNKSSILIGQWSKKLTDGQSNLLLTNQAHTLDGAIFPWLRYTHAFLLLNYLEIFSLITWFFSCNLE